MVTINDAKVEPDAHAGSREDVPSAKDKVGGHNDFYCDDVKTMKTSRRKGLYYITKFYELPMMFIPLMHPCLIRNSRIFLG